MDQKHNWLSISELAQICGISRQTLIYYDKHDIFKPGYIDEKGYRYYSLYQLPFLREICSLKGDKVSLKEIIDNLHSRNLDNTMELLLSNKQNIEKELAELQQKLNILNERIKYYEFIKTVQQHQNRPYIAQFSERKIMFRSWSTEDVDRREMHMTHMILRRECNQNDIPLAWGWGARYPMDSVISRNYLHGAGGYVNIPAEYTERLNHIPDSQIITAPAGFYACIVKYSMPYETDYLDTLRSWIEENHYIIIGDALDECMLDTTFYTEEHPKDFSQLSIPVNLPGTSIDS